MLIACPECERKVSDRAKACPDCGFPVAEHFAEQQAARDRQARLASRERVGEVDCPVCEARGFVQFEGKDEAGEARPMFSWCVDCKHSGRVHLCRDSAGYYALSLARLDAFLAGDLDAGDEGVAFLGTEPPAGHRYAQAGKIYEEEAD